MKKLLKLDSFWLRIVALVTMTIDHIGIFLGETEFVFMRIIGRLSFPIFMFLTIEGALKTSNKKKYILRLLGLAAIVGIALTIFTFMGGFYKEIAFTSGNIFIDLLLIVLSISILESENKKIKPLIALPIFYIIFSSTVMKLEGCGCNGLYYWLFPPFRTQYSYYTLILGFGFYFAKKFAPKISPLAADPDTEQMMRNMLSVLVLMVGTVAFYVINLLFGPAYESPIDGIQTYAIIAGLFIFFYNGKKGYNAKWFRVAYYLYYPLHIGIIGLIFLIIGV